MSLGRQMGRGRDARGATSSAGSDKHHRRRIFCPIAGGVRTRYARNEDARGQPRRRQCVRTASQRITLRANRPRRIATRRETSFAAQRAETILARPAPTYGILGLKWISRVALRSRNKGNATILKPARQGELRRVSRRVPGIPKCPTVLYVSYTYVPTR